MSLASRIASSSVLKRNSGATGPKVSSRKIIASCGTLASTVGSKKLPPSACRLPPVTTRAPRVSASAMCSSTFVDRVGVDQRALA